MRLWVDKHQCPHNVRVEYNAKYLDDCDHIAQFESYGRKKKDGCYGVVYLRPDVTLPTVVHELNHAAMCFVQAYTDRKAFNRMKADAQDEYIAEATSQTLANFVEQYMKRSGLIIVRSTGEQIKKGIR